MSKIVNPGDKPVGVARWTIAPKSSRAVHSISGEVADPLPEKVAKLGIVKTLVKQGVLADEDAPKSAETPATPVTAPTPPATPVSGAAEPVEETPAKVIKKRKD